jgi:hypothetical protein
VFGARNDTGPDAESTPALASAVRVIGELAAVA